MIFRLTLAVFLLACLAVWPEQSRYFYGNYFSTAGAVVPGVPVISPMRRRARRLIPLAPEPATTCSALPVGTYTLTVEQPGFSKYEETNVQVHVAVTTRVDVVLKVGSATDSVTVTAESSQLKTESAEQSMTVYGKQIAECPSTSASAPARSAIPCRLSR